MPVSGKNSEDGQSPTPANGEITSFFGGWAIHGGPLALRLEVALDLLLSERVQILICARLLDIRHGSKEQKMKTSCRTGADQRNFRQKTNPKLMGRVQIWLTRQPLVAPAFSPHFMGLCREKPCLPRQLWLTPSMLSCFSENRSK
jgi:hypothetical protein